ncbi:hypothetical protein BD779DRAFT_1471329 [Infundibulicybe gibba]|nr:hypothetical protein BD779DRAFT_1471329 [Infundibulicybe gibba]
MTAYIGTERRLVLAFDVGTTYSGISFRYPGQEHVGGDSKTPTVLYYDMDGKVCAAGVEAAGEEIVDKALEHGWFKAEWFKMHLGPKNSVQRCLPPLPPNKTVVDVMGDYMRYLHQSAKIYIQETHPGGAALRTASPDAAGAILGGLVSNERDAGARIRFVMEGEASLNFCIRNDLIVKPGSGVLIVDAGGGTIDLSAYSGESSSQFEEVAPAQCHLIGSIFVTQNACAFIEGLLEDSKYADDADHIAECFDKSTKLRFKDANEPTFIKFGTPRDQDVGLGIRSGQLRLKGTDVASFFDPSVQCIIRAIVEMRRASLKPISHVFLVGGFGASDYLFSKLKQALERLRLDFCRPDTHLRVYGCGCTTMYDPSNAEHVRRVSKKFLNLPGVARLPGFFNVILPKNEQVSEKKEFRKSYVQHSREPPTQFTITCEILCYQGHDPNPQWLDTDSANIPKTCAVVRKTPGYGKKYYSTSYDVILTFGKTELQAQVAWQENGKEKSLSILAGRGPAKIMYDDI